METVTLCHHSRKVDLKILTERVKTNTPTLYLTTSQRRNILIFPVRVFALLRLRKTEN